MDEGGGEGGRKGRRKKGRKNRSMNGEGTISQGLGFYSGEN